MKAIAVAIVGMGPRGLTVLERILEHAHSLPEASRLDIEVFEPGDCGQGVHPAGQSDHLLINTVASQVTMFARQRRGWRGRAVPGAMGAPERLPAAWRSIPAHLRGFGSGHHRRRPSAAQPAGRIPVLGLSARGRPAAGACRRVPPQDPRRGHRPARRWLRAGAGKRCQAGSRLCLSDHGPRLPQAQCRRPPIPLVRRAAQAGQSEPGVLPVAVSDTRAGADSRHGHGRHTGIRTDRARRHRGLDHRTRRSLRRGRGRRPALPALRQSRACCCSRATACLSPRAASTRKDLPAGTRRAISRRRPCSPSAGTDRSQRRRPAGFPGGRAADHPGNGLCASRRRHWSRGGCRHVRAQPGRARRHRGHPVAAAQASVRVAGRVPGFSMRWCAPTCARPRRAIWAVR